MPTIVRFHEIGGPENLKLEELPREEPGKGEVTLRVKALGLFYRGQYLEQPRLPSRLGYEAAGVVEAVGPRVDAGQQGALLRRIRTSVGDLDAVPDGLWRAGAPRPSRRRSSTPPERERSLTSNKRTPTSPTRFFWGDG
jgi:NADPH:quinone reductase-like Zn-dependent oxidoreductase